MLIVDSANAPRIAYGNSKAEKVDKHHQWVKEQTANAVYLKDGDLSPANPERQMGRAFLPADLEARLKKLNRNLLFETNPFDSSKKAVYHLLPNGTKVFICAYENSYMPERSIIRVKEEVVTDWDYVKPSGNLHLDRADLPKHELGETDPETGLRGWKFETDIPAGMKKVNVPWGEFKRGWRTVTIKLVQTKLATPAQVEGVFGADDTAAWATHMGKQKLALPW